MHVASLSQQPVAGHPSMAGALGVGAVRWRSDVPMLTVVSKLSFDFGTPGNALAAQQEPLEAHDFASARDGFSVWHRGAPPQLSVGERDVVSRPLDDVALAPQLAAYPAGAAIRIDARVAALPCIAPCIFLVDRDKVPAKLALSCDTMCIARSAEHIVTLTLAWRASIAAPNEEAYLVVALERLSQPRGWESLRDKLHDAQWDDVIAPRAGHDTEPPRTLAGSSMATPSPHAAGHTPFAQAAVPAWFASRPVSPAHVPPPAPAALSVERYLDIRAALREPQAQQGEVLAALGLDAADWAAAETRLAREVAAEAAAGGRDLSRRLRAVAATATTVAEDARFEDMDAYVALRVAVEESSDLHGALSQQGVDPDAWKSIQLWWKDRASSDPLLAKALRSKLREARRLQEREVG
jgi:hypothetical protein